MAGFGVVPLRPKSFAVLRYLVEHRGQLVSKKEIMQVVWADAHVTDAVLKVCIREIREVLGEEAAVPRFIETAPRRGYRFIGKISGQPSAVSRQQLATRNLQLETRLVGREAKLEQLQRWLEKALGGERQVVFVIGEAGIGKTTLVEVFMERARADGELWTGYGQCLEHYGAGEAYLPALEALGRLGREGGHEGLIEVLRQQAPTWLVQMPWLLSDAELEVLQRKVQGTTRERMLREMAGAVEVLTAEIPLVLVLEDLQWSDYSTLELVSYLGQRRERARLLVIGTYRPVEVILRQHPLRGVKQELQMHRQSQELVLEGLTEAGVREYLAARFAGSELVGGLARVIHQRTDGNPLFMVNVVDYVVARGLMVEVEGQWELKGQLEEVEAGVPESLREMIEKQAEGLSLEEQRVLEAGSVAGVEFSAAAVAAGLEEEVVQIEERCQGLARREQFLRSSGISEWPDGTVAGRYGFIHALYQNVLYERVGVSRRLRFHQRIGEREEAAYGGRAGEIAAELAVHFERGRDYRRAVQYLRQAGENALRKHAYREAISHLTKGLELLKTLPDTVERAQQELMLQIALGAPLIATEGYTALEVEKAYARARELCQYIGETPQLFPVLRGLWTFYLVRAELQTARELAEQLLRLAQSVQNPALLLEAHLALGATLSWLGELAVAREHAEQGITLYNPQKHHSHAFLYGHDPGVICLSYAARILWALGYPDQALKRNHEAITLAQELSHPFSLASALNFAAWLHQYHGEGQAARERAEAVITLSTEQGFPLWVAAGTILRGWALAEQGQGEEGVAQIRQGLAALQAMGTELGRSYLLALLAEAYGEIGQTEEGLSVLAEALATVHRTGERFWEAELYRLYGELSLRSGESETGRTGDAQNELENRRAGETENRRERFPFADSPIRRFSVSSSAIPRFSVSSPEESFQKAVDIARRQSAKSLELRAVMSLSRLWQKQGKKEEARRMLGEIYGWFTEGFDTADLQEAKALLKEGTRSRHDTIG